MCVTGAAGEAVTVICHIFWASFCMLLVLAVKTSCCAGTNQVSWLAVVLIVAHARHGSFFSCTMTLRIYTETDRNIHSLTSSSGVNSATSTPAAGPSPRSAHDMIPSAWRL
ncbi:hypothetical protein HDV63DRAFT_296036 [Trichoderma sp. SZMC 28014]